MFSESVSYFWQDFLHYRYYLSLVSGVGMTLAMTAIAVLLGLVMGLLLVLMQEESLTCKYPRMGKILSLGAKVYIDFIRGTPSIVQLVFIWVVIFGSYSISKVIVGGIAFGINSAAYTAELIRGAMQSLDRGQAEAGRSLGLSAWQTLYYITWPQAWRNIVPGLVNEFVNVLKETAVIGTVGGMDLMRVGQVMISTTGNAAMPLIMVAIIYLILTTIFTSLARHLERKLRCQ